MATERSPNYPNPDLRAAPAPAPAGLTVAVLTVTAVPAEPGVAVEPTRISVAPWDRLDNGELFAWSRGMVRVRASVGVFDWRDARRRDVKSNWVETPVGWLSR